MSENPTEALVGPPVGAAIMSFRWPDGFPRVREDADWARQPLDALALGYDAVGEHGWYANLDPTVRELDALLGPGSIAIDYSGGTGILERRLLRAVGDRPIGIVNVDSSPKFLRLAYERSRDEPRVAFRLIRWLKEAKRLQYVDEALEPALLQRGVDAVVSANAIHLYYDLDNTLRAWSRVLRPGGRALVQSGNIPAEGGRIIDTTVHEAERAAREIVREDARFARFRPVLDDARRMEAHDALRAKYFLAPRPRAYYLDALEGAGLRPIDMRTRTVRAEADEWFDFLAVYHEGILGWAGGSERVEGKPPSDEDVALRKELLRNALHRALGGARAFDATWTYITCEKAA